MRSYGSIPEDSERTERPEDSQRSFLQWSVILTVVVVAYTAVLALMSVPGGRSQAKLVLMGQHKPPDVRYYPHQTIDHFRHHVQSWPQRYYQDTRHWQGPGHPIFIIIGGEDPLDGLLYPFVYDNLASATGGVTYSLEHRFFGRSLPVGSDISDSELVDLLSVSQALEDILQFATWRRRQLGCSSHREDSRYCPVVTVGASYPGFLSFLARYKHPEIVDIAYASSAPLGLYAHTNDADAYYDFVANVADEAVPGCSAAVRSAIDDVSSQENSWRDLKYTLGICKDSIPDYIQDKDLFWQEFNMIVATKFADANMDYYPPGPDTQLERACRIFVYDNDKLNRFLELMTGENCLDMESEVPPGRHGRISASDWSGVGGGPEGFAWDYLSCLLLPKTSFNALVQPRDWSWSWVTEHCEDRFGYSPIYDGLFDTFHFDEFMQGKQDATHILFTNGLHDGWSDSSLLEPPPGTHVVVKNFPNGAHHSDLNHVGPNDQDTDDIKQGLIDIQKLILEWIEESRHSTA